MAYKRGQCWVCHEETQVDSHHIHPIEYSGPRDGKQILLCAKDHKVAHFEAEHYSKEGSFQFPIDNTDEGARLKMVIEWIVKAKLAYESGALGHVKGQQRRMTTISWGSQEELTMAHDLKRALKFTSLERTIKAIVFDKYERLRRAGKI